MKKLKFNSVQILKLAESTFPLLTISFSHVEWNGIFHVTELISFHSLLVLILYVFSAKKRSKRCFRNELWRLCWCCTGNKMAGVSPLLNFNVASSCLRNNFFGGLASHVIKLHAVKSERYINGNIKKYTERVCIQKGQLLQKHYRGYTLFAD